MTEAVPATAVPRREDLPDGSVRIVFAAPILFHAEPRASLTLRAPTAGERWEIGDPRSYIENAAGLGMAYTDREMLVRWIRLLIVDHDFDFIARDRDLSLAILIEDVVLGFFTKARMRLRPPSAPSPDPGQPPATSPA